MRLPKPQNRRFRAGFARIDKGAGASYLKGRAGPQGELELALLNLGVNARDAMPDGGILALAIRRVELFGGADIDGLRGTFEALELADTGVGIPAETLAYFFDPFFTTK